MYYYQSNGYIVESSNTFIDQPQWSSCLRSNSIDEGMDINPLMLTLRSNYSVSSHLSQYTLQYCQPQQQRNRVLDLENLLDHIMTNNLPNQFLKKLHCILTYEILPLHIYWNSDETSFTIHFETELVHKYLPQLFQFFSIGSVVKLLTNYGFKKTKKQKQGIQTYDFQHPQFLASQPTLIDSIIFENPDLDPYGEFIDNFVNQYNYCKLNEYSLKSEINTLEETNLRLKNELDQMRGNIEKLNSVLYFLQTEQYDKINLEEFNMLITTGCYQSPEIIDPQAALITPQIFQSSIEPITNNSMSALTPIDFGLIEALTMSENPAYNFITPTSLKHPSGFLQLLLLDINTNTIEIKNDSFSSF
ncbi:hypothetical protein CONCODRAFT_1972 [Conidiobolus coronatus NRRL 28638]|uniref:HSF-type DNA-binding domain-containing protein n=1 Tax=Conidiobolus coronatus (strain ATCC 28846 / CBS 209.66 / NRRL 28638) TaxID=796925 RepID=A0A137PIY9_CONC2|nr:hypothetical protein CONCODRAFT_1972 [Conidiobolus coronatus NRRL 28638]|eukprot:KXN74901.1 hypothetical protein CONCODRAFT_1972 [Conidiobolus coronatus NRRL 28638]